MRLGKVRILSEYIVDLDNEEMIDRANNSLVDDFYNRDQEDIFYFIETIEDNTLQESDISEFLKEEEY